MKLTEQMFLLYSSDDKYTLFPDSAAGNASETLPEEKSKGTMTTAKNVCHIVK